MSDREKQELAEVFAIVLDARMAELYTQIAQGFTQILEFMMQDLAAIMEQEIKREILERVRNGKQSSKWLDQLLK